MSKLKNPLTDCAITEIPHRYGLVSVSGTCSKCGVIWKLTLIEKRVHEVLSGEEDFDSAFGRLPRVSYQMLKKGICELCLKKEIKEILNASKAKRKESTKG